MKGPHSIGSSDLTAAGLKTSKHICSDDEEFFKQLLTAKKELEQQKILVTVAELAKKIGRAYETVNKFLKKNPVYRYKLKVNPGKKGPKKTKLA